MKRRTIAALLVSAALVLPLGGCASTGEMDQANQTASINSALSSAADEASAKGDKQESLALLERMYKREPTSADIGLRYATALQDAGRSNRSLLVMSPFIQSGKADKNAPLLVEYAAVNASIGNYDVAAENARKAAIAAPQNGQAWHILGIALDAKGNHPEAEDAFRKALQNWQGDPSPVMNNLGLNLASQGFIDEAVTTLKKAVELAPGRPEIERNLRIVTALQNQPGTHENKRVPPPARKPENKPADNKATENKTATDSKTAASDKPVPVAPEAKTAGNSKPAAATAATPAAKAANSKAVAKKAAAKASANKTPEDKVPESKTQEDKASQNNAPANLRPEDKRT